MASSIIEPIVFPNELRKTGYQKNYLKLVFTKHKVSNKNANLEITEIQHPVMFLPIAPRLLVESVSANYNTENIGVLGNVLFSNIREYGMTPEGVQGAMAHTIDNFKATEALEAFVTSGILRADNAAIKAGTYAEGVAYNPNTTTFFQGQNQAYRLFYFTWNLFAKNEIDSFVAFSRVAILLTTAVLLPTILEPINSDISANVYSVSRDTTRIEYCPLMQQYPSSRLHR